MKIKLYCLLLCISFASHAQSFLTNAEVYNFDIGDVIQARFYIPWTYTTIYETKTILKKTYSKANDTLFYLIKKELLSIHSTNSSLNTYKTSTEVDSITNLNGIALHNNQSSACLSPPKDTVYSGFCNKTIWEKHTEKSLSCDSSPNEETTYFVKGLGGPYYIYLSAINWTALPASKYELIYYSNSSGTCGTLVTSVQELGRGEDEFSLYPNPANNELLIKTTNTYKKYDIMNVYGQCMQFQNIKSGTIDISQLPKGIYILSLHTNEGSIHKQKFLKE
jgi:hypothetical protein